MSGRREKQARRPDIGHEIGDHGRIERHVVPLPKKPNGGDDENRGDDGKDLLKHGRTTLQVGRQTYDTFHANSTGPMKYVILTSPSVDRTAGPTQAETGGNAKSCRL